MTEQKRGKLIDRVKKLLRLAGEGSGTTVEEMSAAAAKAKELMDAHAIEVAEVTIDDAGDTQVHSELDIVVGHSHEWPQLRDYMQDLGSVVAKITTTEFLIYKQRKPYKYGGKWRTTVKDVISFLGDRGDVPVACEMYRILLKSIHDSVKVEIAPGYGSRQRCYCEGFVQALWVRVNHVEETATEVTALVLRDKGSQVAQALAKLNPEQIEQKRTKGSEDANARWMGFMAGTTQDIGVDKRLK